MQKLYINTDGGSRNNPGPSAIGVVFFDDKEEVIHTHKEYLGIATNNEAEYRAIIKALKLLVKSKWFSENNISDKEVICRLDSQLVVEQINGNYKVKQEHILRLIQELRELVLLMKLKISFFYIPREQNKLADKLVNEALDEVLKK